MFPAWGWRSPTRPLSPPAGSRSCALAPLSGSWDGGAGGRRRGRLWGALQGRHGHVRHRRTSRRERLGPCLPVPRRQERPAPCGRPQPRRQGRQLRGSHVPPPAGQGAVRPACVHTAPKLGFGWEIVAFLKEARLHLDLPL